MRRTGSPPVRCRVWLRLACGIACVLVLPSAATGHGRSLSYSTWTLDAEGADVRSRISRLDLTRLALDPLASPEDAESASRLLARTLRLSAGAAECAPRELPALLPGPEGWLIFAWRVRCAHSGLRRLSSELLLDVAPSHLHFARIELADGRVLDRVLSESEPEVALDSESPSGAASLRDGSSSSAAIARYFSIGVGHILSGWDHLAFVAALLLLASALREVAALVSAFTLAHSLTLALAATGSVLPRAAPVEALIGFSIALTAAETAWILGGRDRWLPRVATGLLLALALAGCASLPRSALWGLALFTQCHFALLARSSRPARLRVALGFAFGLVHGLGFAGALAELNLPSDRLVAALLGFNLGVEAGQLLVVSLVWPLLRGMERLPLGGRSLGRRFAEVASAAICGLGLFWFATRALA